MNRRDFIRIGMVASGASLALRGSGGIVSQPEPSLILDYLRSRMLVQPRSAWADSAPRVNLMARSKPYSRITVHHAGDVVNYHKEKNRCAYDINGVYGGHINQRYGDIGYHFVIDFAGRLWEGRSLLYEGAHVSARNGGNIGVMLMGNFEKQQPSQGQICSLVNVVKLLCDCCNIDTGSVYGHRDLGQSACPGKNLYPYVNKLKVKS